MIALAIDTSNLVLGVAVANENKVLAEFITNEKKNHSVRLMPAIEMVLKELDIEPNELDRIVVARGPGSYTGVRIGVTVAKSMAWSLNIPLVGVSSLEILAQNGRYFTGYVSPLFDGRRGQIYTGLYAMKNKRMSLIEHDRLVLAREWGGKLRELHHPVLFLGNDVAIHRQTFTELLGDRAMFGNNAQLNPRPGELAMLGLIRKPETNVHSFVPNYARLAEAEAKWLAARKSRKKL